MSKENRDAFLLILPLLLFTTVFLLIPVMGTFYISLYRDITFLSRKFIGFANYLRLFKSPEFWQSLVFTVCFAAVSVSLEMFVGMAIALVINESFPARGLIRGIALLPWAIPSVIGARIWQLLYRYDIGFINYLFRGIFGFSVNWLGSSVTSFISLVTADVWRTSPFVAIILLAGLAGIPEVLYTQAKIDGADMFKRFIHVTLPVLRPVLIIALIFRTVDAVRVFDLIYVITGGGPGGSTTSLSLYSYNFFLLGDFGYGAAGSVVLFLIAFLITAFYLKAGKFEEALT